VGVKEPYSEKRKFTDAERETLFGQGRKKS